MGFRIFCYNKLWVAYDFLIFFSFFSLDGRDGLGWTERKYSIILVFFFPFFSLFFSPTIFIITTCIFLFFFWFVAYVLSLSILMMMITSLRPLKFFHMYIHRWMGFLLLDSFLPQRTFGSYLSFLPFLFNLPFHSIHNNSFKSFVLFSVSFIFLPFLFFLLATIT